VELPSTILFEVPKKCFSILAIDDVLNSFAQNLHFNLQELPCFIGGVINSTNVHSSALKGGSGIVCFLEIFVGSR
jgi:hypothetical protein